MFEDRNKTHSRHLFVQSQQWKHQNNMLNLFNKDSSTTSMVASWYLYFKKLYRRYSPFLRMGFN